MYRNTRFGELLKGLSRGGFTRLVEKWQTDKHCKGFTSYLLDSTPINLKGNGFDSWTLATRTQKTQGLKLHLLLHNQIMTPHYINLAHSNINDITDAANVVIESRATYVFDKGYCDYNWWHRINEKKAYFITRFKKNASLIVEKEQIIPAENTEHILSDTIVKFKNKHPRAGHTNHYEAALRRIIVRRPDHDTPLILATNDFERSAEEIADCYKARWGVELYFKWIKQNLKIKRYLGRTENAVRIQIATALISYLLMALYQHTQGFRDSLKALLILVSTTLFQRPEIDNHMRRKRQRELQEGIRQRQGVLI